MFHPRYSKLTCTPVFHSLFGLVRDKVSSERVEDSNPTSLQTEHQLGEGPLRVYEGKYVSDGVRMSHHL